VLEFQVWQLRLGVRTENVLHSVLQHHIGENGEDEDALASHSALVSYYLVILYAAREIS
jgi:hypothetical protein